MAVYRSSKALAVQIQDSVGREVESGFEELRLRAAHMRTYAWHWLDSILFFLFFFFVAPIRFLPRASLPNRIRIADIRVDGVQNFGDVWEVRTSYEINQYVRKKKGHAFNKYLEERIARRKDTHSRV